MAFIDARDLPEGTEIEADLVIIGAGMAGIAIATEWVSAGKRVALIESGGRDYDQATQDLYRGSGSMRGPDNPDQSLDDYLWQSRFRALGGSGNIWGGKCVPLDPADFAEREWLPRTGWPLSRAQLQPYYDRACALLQVPLFNRDYSLPQEEGRPPLAIDTNREFFSAPRCFSPISGTADPEKFEAFRTGFATAGAIDVYLNANVVSIRRARGGRRVADLGIACLNGRRHLARGRAYVLATGGIENARLLLASNLGGESNVLGRHFMGHVTYSAPDESPFTSMIALSDAHFPMGLYTDNARDRFHCVLAATLEGQRRFNVGNFTTTISGAQPAPNEGAALLRLTAALDRTDMNAAPAQSLPVYFMSEHLPNPESRITLDPTQTDALGVPRVRLEWVYSARDFDNLEAAIAGLAATLGEAHVGRVRWPVRREQLLTIASPSRHHMGATRMNANPEFGVVDEHCRVHGLRNLFVAGSSVFPTSGIANPTLTLTALALRLSDHLKSELGARS